MKIQQVVYFNDFYTQRISNQQMNVTLAYKFNKILSLVSNDLNFYQTELLKIFEDCVEKEGDTFKVDHTKNEFIVKSDKIDEFNTRFNALAAIDINDIEENLKINIDELNGLEITPIELAKVQNFFK